MRRAVVVPLGVCLAVVLVAAGWWFGKQQAAAPIEATRSGAIDESPTEESIAALPPAEPASAGVEVAAGPAAAPTAAPAAALAPPPLPPHDAPLVEVFDDLLARAREGDARAACRLATDLQRCRMASMWGGRGGGGWGRGGRGDRGGRGGRGGDWESRIAEIQDETERERMIEMLAQAETQREQAQQVCEGVTSAQLAQAFPMQVQAAASRPELRVDAALMPALDRMFPASELEHWQQYRQTALPWLQQAAAQGDLTAIIALARVHGDDRRRGPPVPPFRDLDDARFVTYATLLERYGVQVPAVAQAAEQARARLEADVLRQAEAQADALHRPGLSPDATQREAAMRQSFGTPPDPARCD